MNKITADATATGKAKPWIMKTGVYNSVQKQIDWIIEVNTNDRRLRDLILYDSIPEGLTLIPGTFLVNDVSAAPDSSGEDLTGKDYTFSYQLFTTALEPAVQTYTIQYTTSVDKPDGRPDEMLENEAWLSFTWIGGGIDGTDEPMYPSVSKYPDVPDDLLQKEGEYDPATHEITWTVTVNPEKVNFKSGTITDDLSDLGQTYVDNSFSAEDSGLIQLDINDSTNKFLTITVGELGTDSSTFTFKTTVDEPEDFANNKTTTYKNRADMEATIVLENGSEMEVPTSALGEVKVVSNVLKKAFVSYDYATHEITWKLTVNENKMPLENVVLTDTLPAEQTPVLEKITVTSDNAEEITVQNSFDETTRALKIELGSLNTKVEVIYVTILDADKIENVFPSISIESKNSVKLTRKNYDDVSASSTAKIPNKLLTKSGIKNAEEEHIDYTVVINPNELRLAEGCNRIVDQLSSGLLLDQSTVELSAATVDEKGNLAKGDPCNSDSWAWEYDAQNRKLTVTLPKEKKAYLLTYSADIVSWNVSGFTNKIAFEGEELSESQNSSVSFLASGGGGGGILSLRNRKGCIDILKRDYHVGSPVEGVAFCVYDKDAPARILDYGVTDKEGRLSFSALPINHTYVVEEVASITGYNKTGILSGESEEKTTWEVLVERSVAAGVYKLELTNTRVTGDLSFTKTNSWNRKLTGATFTLTPTGSTPGADLTKYPDAVKTAVSNENGIVLFKGIPTGPIR